MHCLVRDLSCEPNILIHTRAKGKLAPLNMFEHSSDFYGQFQGGASFVDLFFFVIYVSSLSLLNCPVMFHIFLCYSLQPCDQLTL